MRRSLVLFAREPARQAREKGFRSGAAEELFRGFAEGWLEACRGAGARLIVATPPEDRFAWARALPASDVRWIWQRGDSLGARLEDAARRAAALGGPTVLVGGDVAPSAAALTEVFDAIEAGADAAISPSPDGGISLLALSKGDLDLLGGIRTRRRTLLRDLQRELLRRGRCLRVVAPAADVDGRGSLRMVLREGGLPETFSRVARQILAGRFSHDPGESPESPSTSLYGPTTPRAPPAA
jgi:hypothetical protein